MDSAAGARVFACFYVATLLLASAMQTARRCCRHARNVAAINAALFCDKRDGAAPPYAAAMLLRDAPSGDARERAADYFIACAMMMLPAAMPIAPLTRALRYAGQTLRTLIMRRRARSACHCRAAFTSPDADAAATPPDCRRTPHLPAGASRCDARRNALLIALRVVCRRSARGVQRMRMLTRQREARCCGAYLRQRESRGDAAHARCMAEAAAGAATKAC